MTWPPTVLVIGAEGRQGLTILRSLGRAGIRTVAAATDNPGVGLRSRYVTQVVDLPVDPPFDAQVFAGRLREVVQRHGITTIFPGPESAVIALDAVRDTFVDQTLVLAPHDSLATVLDKSRTHQLAERLGVPIPVTRSVSTCEQAAQFAQAVGYPLALKPVARPTYGEGTQPLGFKVRYAADAATLEQVMREVEARDGTVIIQSYAPGGKRCHGLLADHGRIVAVYEYRGRREAPVTGGVTSLHEPVPITDRILEVTRRLIADLRWDGLAMVEYRWDPATGDARLLEINGRAWAPIAGAVRAGLDFPMMALRLAHGQPVGAPVSYRMTRTQEPVSDIRAWCNLGQVPDDFPEPVVGRGRLAAHLVRDALFAKSEHWAWDDPMPGVAAIGRIARDLARRVLPKR
jgi:predicted ATP-grasp superfamily ATP-dependent carboligase